MSKTRIFATFMISIFLIAGVFAQTSLIVSTVPTKNPSQSAGELSPSNTEYDYNLGGGNSMDLDGSGNLVDTTLATESSLYEINSDFVEGAEGSSKTKFNNNYEIETNKENTTIMRDLSNNFIATIDNGFKSHAVSLETDTGDVNVSAGVLDNQLQNFIVSGEAWSLDYYKSSLEETLVCSNDLSVIAISRYGTEGVNESILIGTVEEKYFNITTDGTVYWDEFGDGSWEEIGVLGLGLYGGYDAPFEIDIAGEFGEWGSYTVVIQDSLNNWEILLVWVADTYYDLYVSCLTFPLSIQWPSLVVSITISYGLWTYLFYLDLLSELLFVIIYNDYDFKLESYLTYLVIVWQCIEISIINLNLSIHWIILFWWECWFIKIQFWFVFLDIWIFIDYTIWIEYRWTTYNWIYIYSVPLETLPNPLIIQIIEKIFDENKDEFIITFIVKDLWEELVSSDQINVEWNEEDFSDEVETDDVGIYSVKIDAIYVDKKDDSIELKIEAEKRGYADGSLQTDLSVIKEADQPTTLNELLVYLISGISIFLGASLGLAYVFKKNTRKKDSITII